MQVSYNLLLGENMPVDIIQEKMPLPSIGKNAKTAFCNTGILSWHPFECDLALDQTGSQ